MSGENAIVLFNDDTVFDSDKTRRIIKAAEAELNRIAKEKGKIELSDIYRAMNFPFPTGDWKYDVDASVIDLDASVKHKVCGKVKDICVNCIQFDPTCYECICMAGTYLEGDSEVSCDWFVGEDDVR